ncbi:hypothetical protein ACLH3R_002344, partial [Flavobacterium psychrophilum]
SFNIFGGVVQQAQRFGAIGVLVLYLKLVLYQKNLVNPKVLANLVPNCFWQRNVSRNFTKS